MDSKRDALHEIVYRRKHSGSKMGIPSICTANPIVLEATLQQGLRFLEKEGEENFDELPSYVLIEATSNQVNQFGGYTGMLPKDFREMVYKLADKVGFPKERIILAGDHLGPLVWADEPESEAMPKACELVKLFVLAGYKKIHLDTSMRLGDDPTDEMLSTRTIARRGAELFRVCEDAYQELLKENPDEMRPSYIIGSEVPIPGGSQEKEDHVTVTKVEDLEETIRVYREEFEKQGLSHAFDSIVGVVVQPGVEFGDEDIVHYDREAAKDLKAAMERQEGIVLEGHSTDYQSKEHLREMAEDGIAILKVGPALTFAVREGVFALSFIEKELIPEEKRANFPEVLEEVMMEDKSKWEKHYKGTEEELYIKRKYSQSDRWRYYSADERVENAMQKLFENIDSVHIPGGMLRQYMPNQYIKVRDGLLPLKARELVKDKVVEVIDDYNYATK